MIEDKDGNIWLASKAAGISVFTGDHFEHYNDRNSFANTRIEKLFTDSKGNVWIGASGEGVIKYDGTNFTNYSIKHGMSSHIIRSMVELDNGDLWFGTWGGGITSFDGNTFRQIQNERGKQTDFVRTMCKDNEGNIWMGYAYGKGILKFDGENFTRIKEENGLLNNTVYSVITGFDGNLWIATQAGLSSLKDNKLSHYTLENGLRNLSVRALNIDDFGNIWLGTWGGGVQKISPHSFKHFTAENGLKSSRISSVKEDLDGNIWAATHEGAVQYSGTEFSFFTDVEGLIQNNIYCSHIDQKGVSWFGTLNGGLVKLDSSQHTTYNITHGLSARTVFAIDEDMEGNLWLGTNGGGVSRFDGKEFDHFSEDQGMSDGIIRAVKIDNEGTLWVGTLSQGICKITTPSSPGESTITYITTNEGLSSNQVYSFQIDKNGNLWIGTDSGLEMIDPKKDIVPNQDNFIHYNTKNGLTNNNALSMTIDRVGDLWVCTKKGINRLRISQQENNQPMKIQQFGKYDGLISTDSYINSSHVDSKNRLWSGTGKSLLMLEIDELLEAKNAPIPELSHLEIDQQFYNYRQLPDSIQNIAFDSVASFANYPVNLELPYYKNHLTFYFTAPDWAAPHNVEYSYKMEPLNTDWSQVSSQNSADYRNLNYGEYTFMLRAKGNSEMWSPIFNYSFTIHPPWWHTWWARTLYGLSIILIFVLFYRWRTQKMRQRQEELEQEVELATVEIRSQKEEVENQKEMIEEAHKEITDSIAYAKRIQNAILPPQKMVKQHLNNSFVLYLPKDVVAGDFYWMQKMEEAVLFAAADCTGHGVPGAMVSVVCNNALTRSVREYNLSDPGEILDSVREIVIQEFATEGETTKEGSWEVKDGMDIALVSLNGLELKYAGAHNPLWVIRKGEVASTSIQTNASVTYFEETGFSLIEIKANKQPIGVFIQPVPFKTHSLQLEKEDTIYVFSDGLVDQFGGEKGKKFKPRAFKNLLLNVQNKPMDEQKKLIENAFVEWMGSLEQIDDVCVIGVRV